MSGGMGAAGDVAAGILLGRAVEPAAGESARPAAHSACLNCGTALIGEFCHACGQNGHVHTTLRSIGHDLLHGVFHFEGKVWRTLPMLAVHPGHLTRRYIAGERARFVSPLALFLFTVFLMFAAFESFGPPLRPQIAVEHRGRILDPGELATAIAQQRRDVARLAAASQAGGDPKAIDRQLVRARDDLAGLENAQRIVLGVANPQALAPQKVQTGWSHLDDRIAAARANPALLLFQLQANAHKFAWAIIPISVPFLWLMFAWRRGYRLYDHTVFVTYSLCAVMLLLVAMAALGGAGISLNWALILVPLHFFVQLRGAYRLGWWGALWRSVGLIVAACVSLSLFATLLVAIGLAG